MQTEHLTPEQLNRARLQCSLSAAVFGKRGPGASLLDVAVVFLDEDNGGVAAEVAARGYVFCGSIGVIADGEPQIEVEPIAFASAALAYGGVLFAEKLGVRLKALQLAQLEQRTTNRASGPQRTR